jgi:hypothetical protein
MDIPCLSRLADEADAHPLACSAKVVMDGSHGQKSGNSQIVVIDSLVTQY